MRSQEEQQPEAPLGLRGDTALRVWESLWDAEEHLGIVQGFLWDV